MTPEALAGRYERAVAAWAAAVVRRPLAAVAFSLASLVALASGARFLTFSTDYRAFFSPDNPQLQAFEELQNVYGKNDNTVAMFRARHGGDVFQPRVLEAIRAFTAAAWELPYTTRVDSITNFQHTRAAGDDLAVAALLPDGAEITPQRIAVMREVVLNEPLLVGRLVSRTGQAAGVAVTASFPQESVREVPAAVNAARALRDRIEAQHPEVDIALSGVNLFNIAFTEASQADLTSLIPAMYLLMTVITWLLLRSAWATAATLALVGLATATAMGIAGYAGVRLTPPALAAPIVITTLAVADSLHLFVSMFAALRAGRSRHEAIVEALRVNFTPIFLTSVTTAVGFLSINFTDSPPLRDLGNIAAVGVMMAWIYSIVLLPALMRLLPIRVPAHRAGRTAGLMRWLAEFVLRHDRVVLWGGIGVTGVLFAAVALNRVDDNFVRYFDHRLEFRRDAEAVIRDLTGTFAIDFSLRAGGPDGVADPAFLRRLDAFAEWWKAQPNVVHVSSIADTFRRLNRNMHGDDPAYHRLPESRELAAQYLLLYEMSLPFGLDLNNTLNLDKSAVRFTVVLHGHTKTPDVRDAIRSGERWLRENAPDMATPATGTVVMFVFIAERNLQSMLTQMPLSVAFIWLLLLPLLRSVRIGLLTLLPLACPVAMAFGVWGLIDGWINFTMAVVLGVVTGIVDDDTVHFLSHYLRARRDAGMSPENAIRYTFETAGSALLATSAILIGGFLVLAQSAFLPNGGMAQLAAIAIAAALAFNLLLLPPLLRRIDRAQAPATREIAHGTAPA